MDEWERRHQIARIANRLLREGCHWPEVIQKAEEIYQALTNKKACDNNYLT